MAIPMILNLDGEGNCKQPYLPKKKGIILHPPFVTCWFSVKFLTKKINWVDQMGKILSFLPKYHYKKLWELNATSHKTN